MRTVPGWHIRNRSKSRWLRRAWLFLLFGVILLGTAAILLLLHLLEIPEAGGKEGPATTLISEWTIGGFIAGIALLSWLAVVTDWPLFAGRRDDEQKRNDSAESKEIDDILQALSGEPTGRVVADCRDFGDNGFNCSLMIAGQADEVARTVIEHVVSLHGYADDEKLREQVRDILHVERVTSDHARNSFASEPLDSSTA
jgi:predicted small metal-binding protein